MTRDHRRRSSSRSGPRKARWRTITFRAPENELRYEVLVVPRVTSGIRPQIIREQDVQLAAIEAQNDGVVPITHEEYASLVTGNVRKMRRLARRKTSALWFIHDWSSANEPPHFQVLRERMAGDTFPPVESGSSLPVELPEGLPGQVAMVLSIIRHDTISVPAFRQEGDKFVLNLPPGMLPRSHG